LILPDSKSRKVNRFFLGVEAGATLWNHKISKDYTSDLALFDFNYQNSWGWQTSVSLGYNLNQYIGVIANFQYDQIETTSGHNSNLKYSIQEEQGINNPLNGYALNLATPYGLSGATFNFNRSQTLATDEVNLVVDFSSRHSIKNFSLPIGTVIYPFGRSKRIIPTLSVGFGLNYLAQITNKIQSIETHHDHIKYDDSGSATFVSPVLEKWHFDYRLGLGLKYKLRKGLHLQIKYDWVKGVSPIFKQNIYETRISRHQVSLGLTKSITP
jgi:opacity protein-like surface antigen